MIYIVYIYIIFLCLLAGILTKDLVMVQFKPELDLKAKDKRGEFIFVLDRSGQWEAYFMKLTIIMEYDSFEYILFNLVNESDY